MKPLVAVVTLTTPGREEFLELRKKEVRQQTYSRIEHVVVPGPQTLGWKRNEGVRLAIAAGAEIVVNADDDDILLPHGVEIRVEKLLEGAEICSTSRLYSYDLRGGYGVMTSGKYVHDAALAYWTRTMNECQFNPAQNMAEASAWMKHFKGRIFDLRSLDLFVYIYHGGNRCAKQSLYRKYRKDATKEIQAMMGEDLPWYLARQEVPYCEEPTAT